jgi:hypothetical protein
MTVIRHWVAKRKRDPQTVIVLVDEGLVRGYRAGGGWTVTGPFVPEEQLAGAVEAGDALADAVSDIMADDPESVLHTWVRRWHEAAHPGGQ